MPSKNRMPDVACAKPLPAVEMVALIRCFGAFKAVDGVTMSLTAGGILGLLGPNGAGKTTTIKMLITMLPPSSGTARVAGYDIVRQPVQVRQRIGYVPQLLSADGALTGYENLDLFAKLYGIPRECRRVRIEEALALMGLREVADKLASHYFSGRRSRSFLPN